MAEIGLDSLISGIKEAFKSALLEYGAMLVGKVSSAPAGSASGTSGAVAPSIMDSLSGLADFAKATGGVATSMAAIGHSTDAASAVFTKVGSHLGKDLGGITTDLVKSLSSMKEQIDTAGKVGVGDNNYFKLQAQAGASGQSIADFTKTIASANGTLSSFGITQSAVAENLSKFSQDVQESDIGGKLKSAGWDAPELAKVGAIAAMNTRLNMADAASRIKLAGTAAELADQLDRVARVTGQSREKLEDELRSREALIDNRLLEQSMSDEQHAAFQRTKGSLQDMGTEINRVALEVASHQKISDTSLDTLRSMGKYAGEFQAAILEQEAAKTDQEKADATRHLVAVDADIKRYQQSREHAANVMSGDDKSKAQQMKVTEQLLPAAAALTALDKSGKTAEELDRELRKKQEGLNQDGTVDAGQVLSRTMNDFNERVRNAGVGGALVLQDFNNELGSSPKLIKGLNDALITATGGKKLQTPQDFANISIGAKDKIKSSIANALNVQPTLSGYDEEHPTYIPKSSTVALPSLSKSATNSAIPPAAEPAHLPPAPVLPEFASLKDLHTAIDLLNNQMSQMLSYTQTISTSTKRSADLAATANGNRSPYN
jgi:hypothetical protein